MGGLARARARKEKEARATATKGRAKGTKVDTMAILIIIIGLPGRCWQGIKLHDGGLVQCVGDWRPIRLIFMRLV